jgi:integrase
MDSETASPIKVPWNKGKIVGQKTPLRLKDIWAIRIRLQLGHRTRELALFDLGLDSKPRACDMVRLRVRDICHGDHVSSRAIVMQQKTSQPVQFEITPPTRDAVAEWIKEAELANDDYLFPSRVHDSPHLGTRQYARILDSWIEEIGLDPTAYGTHTMRRTKASLIYRRTKNIRAVQLLLGHTKLESTVRYLGVEVEDALELSEQTEI